MHLQNKSMVLYSVLMGIMRKEKKLSATKLGIAFGAAALFLIVSNLGPFVEFVGSFTIAEKRIAAIFIMAALLWVLEPIPNYTTSLLVIVLELILLSDKGLKVLRQGDVGQLLSYKDIIASFAAPIIVLFLGGFALARVAEKYKIDYAIAKFVLKPFGTKPMFTLLGLMVVTALFSMFMSNTATTAMMLSVLTPVIRGLPKGDRIKGAFALGIPFAANIGGMGTPIGTPPNAIALRTLAPDIVISFSQWMSFAVPIVVVLLLVCWMFLVIFFPTKTKQVNLHFDPSAGEKIRKKNKPKTLMVYATFAATILLWMTDFLHGMNSYVVAMIPLLVFFVSNTCTREDLRVFNWDVLWLISGGVALGHGIEKTGLGNRIAAAMQFDSGAFVALVVISMVMMYVLSNFMSNTAASHLFLPILLAIGYSTPGVTSSMVTFLIITVAFTASLTMLLPVSTPPNALGYGTGFVNTKDMFIHGIIIGVVGMVGTYFYFSFLSAKGWL